METGILLRGNVHRACASYSAEEKFPAIAAAQWCMAMAPMPTRAQEPAPAQVNRAVQHLPSALYLSNQTDCQIDRIEPDEKDKAFCFVFFDLFSDSKRRTELNL